MVRVPSSQMVPHHDAWENILTGLGDINYDKQMAATVMTPIQNNVTELDALYAGDDLFSKIVELPPKEMLRQGFQINTAIDKLEAWVMDKFVELGVGPSLVSAMSWARAYGGAGAIIGADDGLDDPSKELVVENIKTIKWIRVLDRFDITVNKRYTDPKSTNIGEPELYQILGINGGVASVQSALVHESRVIRFDGIISSNRRKRENEGWGDSVYVRLKQTLRQNDQTWSGAAHLMTDFAQAVYQIEGLSEMLEADNDEAVLARIRIIERARSLAKLVPIDKNETFTRTPTPLTGLPDIMSLFMKRVSGASGVPVSILMGDNPAGLNATGDSTIRFFYDSLAAEQQNFLLPILNKLVYACLASDDSPFGDVSTEDWKIVFNPLWQMTQAERAELRLKTSQADQADIQNGILDPSEVTQSRYGGEAYSIETALDTEARSAFTSAIDGDTGEGEETQGETAYTPGTEGYSPDGD